MVSQLLVSMLLMAAPPVDSPADIPELARKADVNYTVRDWPKAMDFYERLIALNPTNGMYYYRLGDALLNAKRYPDAVAPLEKAHELGGFQGSPPRWIHRGEAAFLLAAAHAGTGNRSDALQWTRTSLREGLRSIRKFHAERFALLRDDPEFCELVWADVDRVDSLSRDERFRRDLEFAIHELKRIHFSPFRATPEAKIDRQVAALDTDIPNLTDDQIYVRLMAIVRLFGDAHTRMLRDTPLLPVVLFVYPEGLHVLGAGPGHERLVGAKILAIGGQPTDEVVGRAKELVAVENPMTATWEVAGVLRSLTVLRGLGLAPAAGAVALQIEDAAGQRRSVSLSAPEKPLKREDYHFAVPGCQTPLPLCLRNRGETMWHAVLPDGRTVYCQLNGIGHGKRNFARYFEALFAEIESSPIERLILDLRWNNGGNTFLNPALIEGLQRSNKLRQRGTLFVIIGRNTFSAALNTTGEIERRTAAIFVGEPTSSPPNFVGESVEVILPASRWPISISDLSWQTSFPMDYRVWISPTLYAPPTAAALRAHRDPAMEVIEAYLAKPTKPAK